MPKRMVDTELWNDENIIENFTAEDKYFWLYLLTSPHNTICGVLKNSPVLIARDMGLHKDTIVNLIYRFENYHHLIFCDKETSEMLILNWYKYNWTKSPKIIALIEREMENIKSVHIRDLLKIRINDIQGNMDDTLSIPYRYPPNTNTNTNSISNKVSKNVSKDIYKQTKKEPLRSYEDVMRDFCVAEIVKPTLWEFIKHCQLNGRKLTNDRLETLICDLDTMHGTDEYKKVEALQQAINGGFFDIKKE